MKERIMLKSNSTIAAYPIYLENAIAISLALDVSHVGMRHAKTQVSYSAVGLPHSDAVPLGCADEQ